MAILTERQRAVEGLLSEGPGSISRDAITIVSGAGVLAPGTVLGKITASGKYKPATATGSDGGQTAVAVLVCGVDATSADVEVTAITRNAEWAIGDLTYDSSVDDDAKKLAKRTQLAAVGIIAR